MSRISKIILFVDDVFIFGVKRVPRQPAKDRRLELLGGHVEKGETPLEGLIRELEEEESSALLANKASAAQLSPVEIKVGGDRHFIFRMPIVDDELDRIALDSEEHYGYQPIPRAVVMDPELMKDGSVFSARTVKIFSKLRQSGYFPYDR